MGRRKSVKVGAKKTEAIQITSSRTVNTLVFGLVTIGMLGSLSKRQRRELRDLLRLMPDVGGQQALKGSCCDRLNNYKCAEGDFCIQNSVGEDIAGLQSFDHTAGKRETLIGLSSLR